MPAIRGLIFDHDGTLVDSIPAVVAATNQVLRDLGLPPEPPERVVSAMVLATGPRMGHHTGSDDPAFQARLAQDFYHHARRYGPAYSSLYAGIGDALVRFAERGIAMAVLSNNEGRLIRNILRRLGILERFAAVFGEEDVPAPKPDPEGLRRAVQALGVDPVHAVFVGDSQVDAYTARAAGVRSFGVTWGISPREELEAYGFDLLIDTPRELIAAVTALDEETMA